MTIVHVFMAALIGYGLGCIQTAYILGRVFKKIDIRKYGSSNAGASNATIVMGWKYGLVTALVDILKATAAVVLIKSFFPSSPILSFVAGAFAILGHIFPVYLRFRGGKGAASLIGMLLPIDFKIALLLVLTIVLITILLDYIAVGTIAMYFILPISTYYLRYPIICTLIGVGLAVLCIYKHAINISRILKGQEVGLRKVIQRT